MKVNMAFTIMVGSTTMMGSMAVPVTVVAKDDYLPVGILQWIRQYFYYGNRFCLSPRPIHWRRLGGRLYLQRLNVAEGIVRF